MVSLSENRIPGPPKFGQDAKVAARPEMEELVKYGRQIQKTLELLQSAIIDLQERVKNLES